MSETLDSEDREGLKQCGAGRIFRICVDNDHEHMIEHVREIAQRTMKMMEEPWTWIQASYWVWSDVLDEPMLIHSTRLSGQEYNKLLEQRKI